MQLNLTSGALANVNKKGGPHSPTGHQHSTARGGVKLGAPRLSPLDPPPNVQPKPIGTVRLPRLLLIKPEYS